MTDATNGAAAPSGGAVAPVNVQTETGPISMREAAAQLAARREKGQAAAEPEAPAEGETEQTQQPQRGPDGKFAARRESTPQGEDAGPEEVPGEVAEADPADELPPIEPPRSWSKEDKALFDSLPRETQERVAERERSRESDFLRRQNEAADKSKALEAKEKAAEQARQQYESAAQNALQVLQQQQASEFADIKTYADVQKLATDDPFRFAQFQARQMQIAAQAQEVEALNRQRQEDRTKTFKAWADEQDSKFTKKFPEFADKDKAGKAREQIVSYLTKDIGVPEDQLPKLWETDLFRDAMFQEVVYDASRFRAAQAKAKAAVQKPVPPVQRPGVAQGKGEARQADIAALQNKLASATNVRDQITAAAALAAAKRQQAAH